MSEVSKTLPLGTKFKGTRKLSNEDKQYVTQYFLKNQIDKLQPTGLGLRWGK